MKCFLLLFFTFFFSFSRMYRFMYFISVALFENTSAHGMAKYFMEETCVKLLVQHTSISNKFGAMNRFMCVGQRDVHTIVIQICECICWLLPNNIFLFAYFSILCFYGWAFRGNESFFVCLAAHCNMPASKALNDIIHQQQQQQPNMLCRNSYIYFRTHRI